MLKDAEGYYRVATTAQKQAWQIQCQEQRAQQEATSPHIAEIPVQGTERGLVLLIEYPDVKFTLEDPLQHFTDMMMKPGFDYAFNATTKYRHKGSVHEYFYEASGGLFDLQLDVVGPIMMPDSVKHYATNSDRLAWEMIVKGCQLVDDSIDFTQYDQDGDGRIDFIASIYAGPGSNASGVSEDQAIWPHQWTVSSAGGGQNYVDSVMIDTYVCVNETYGGRPDGMGTFCHEFSHILGLPDLYSGSNCTPGNYDLMDNGCYNLNGYRPATYTAYERYEMGWLEPTLLTEEGVYTLPALTLENKAYIVPVTQGIADPRDGEYYLFENRQPYRWDEYLPGHGMLVWHIDYVQSRWAQNKPNGWSSHQCVDLIEADGKKKVSGSYSQDGSTPFPGTGGHTSFTDDTDPAFSGWTEPQRNTSGLNVRLEKPIYNIREIELSTEQVPSDVMAETTLYEIQFDFLADISGIEEVRMDEANVNGAHIIIQNGQPVLRTGSGCFDIFGRKL